MYDKDLCTHIVSLAVTVSYVSSVGRVKPKVETLLVMIKRSFRVLKLMALCWLVCSSEGMYITISDTKTWLPLYMDYLM